MSGEQRTGALEWRRVPPDSILREVNQRLNQLAGVVYALNGLIQESRKPSITYRILADNLYAIWKRHATNLHLPVAQMADEIACELGYAALAVYSIGSKSEREAYVRAARLVCDLLLEWERKAPQTVPLNPR